MWLDNVLHRMVFLLSIYPIFYTILVGSFQLQTLYDSIPGVPQTELSCSFADPSYSLAAFFFEVEKGRGLFLAYPSDCFVLILLLSARQKREKPKPPPTPQEKPQTLIVEMYLFMTYSLPKYSSGTVRWELCFQVLSMVSDLHVSCILIQASVLSADQL